MKKDKIVSDKFKGLWIPAKLLLDESTSMKEKSILSFVYHLNKIGECYASNKYFSELLKIIPRSIQSIIKSLKDKNLIEIKLIYNKETQQVSKRIMNISSKGVRSFFHGGGEENFMYITKTNNKDKKLYINDEAVYIYQKKG